MSTPDIREGDLVKATSKAHPEEYAVYRVTSVGKNWVDGATRIADRNAHTFEVLERPLPPIDEELLFGAVCIYRSASRYPGPTTPSDVRPYREGITAVINHVREYDRKHATKENA